MEPLVGSFNNKDVEDGLDWEVSLKKVLKQLNAWVDITMIQMHWKVVSQWRSFS